MNWRVYRMKISEKILFIFLFFFFLMAFFSLKACGIGLKYGIFFGATMIILSNFILPSRGIALSGIGLIVMSIPNILLGSIICAIGLITFVIEIIETKKEVQETYIYKYKKKPETIKYRFFHFLGRKERKEKFNSYLIFNIQFVKIKTEEGWKEFYYDNVNKRLIEK